MSEVTTPEIKESFLPVTSAKWPQGSHRSFWNGLNGIASALAVLSAARANERRAIVITPTAAESAEWLHALQFLQSGQKQQIPVFEMPDRETLAFDHFSPHPDIISARLSALYQLRQHTSYIVICTLSTFCTRLTPVDYLEQNSLILKVGERIEEQNFVANLIESGYRRVDSVFEHGDFAVRGGLIDLFPMGCDEPLRIELFDDEIESLRSFDVESQRTLDNVQQLMILPANEVRLDSTGINNFRDQWHLEFKADPDLCPIYEDTVAGVASAGVESYLPMFFEKTDTFADYVSGSLNTASDSVFILPDAFEEKLNQFFSDVKNRHELNAIDPTRPLLPAEKLFITPQEILKQLKSSSRILFENTHSRKSAEAGLSSFGTRPPPDLSIDAHAAKPLARITDYIEQFVAEEIPTLIFCVESAGRREMLLEQLSANNIDAGPLESFAGAIAPIQYENFSARPSVQVAIAAFNRGADISNFPHVGHRTLIISESELFGVTLKPRAKDSRGKNLVAEAAIHSLLELSPGSPVVHIDHGVGRYMGLEHMPVMLEDERVDAEFLALHYANGDKLYVPVTNLHLVGRYMGGDEDSAPLDRLGSDQWQATRKKALQQVRDTAAELLAIYAKREALEGFKCELPEADYQKFAGQFPFEETIDQQTAIDAVIADMCAVRPMDRVVCGDVGFGKTEVAMRASFIAVANSKQVMVLVPTTLLAQQHASSFAERFADWPVKVEVLSRFRTASEQRQILKDFSSGSLDILIGTHKLIQKDVKASDLGLVIIDEEHRFGVSQKEQLKKLCVNVDLLTMTATPIPRTLNLAMSGLRDLSIIATAPSRRLSVKTFVQEKQDSLVKEALLRELLRGGQVFYLHNDIDKISKTAEDIQALVPEARVAIGHGQMPERELEQVMHSFYHKQFNVLVCTTIIETGIDIPNANTIIIERADKFGLAQLHQLRGRVGRSHHQAYAYLFTPSRKALSKDADKRLTAIEESQDLGAGFMLATHDMEIRGAGELLGAQQSGQIHSLGYTMYLDMLEQAVQAIKAGDDVDIESASKPHGEINLHLPALIPDDYLPDVQLRLNLYKRIANAESSEALRELKVEMIDRFGLLPEAVKNLFTVTEMKLCAMPIGIERIDSSPHGGFLEFGSKTTVEPLTIVKMVQDQPAIFSLQSATKLRYQNSFSTTAKRLEWLQTLINTLAKKA